MLLTYAHFISEAAETCEGDVNGLESHSWYMAEIMSMVPTHGALLPL